VLATGTLAKGLLPHFTGNSSLLSHQNLTNLQDFVYLLMAAYLARCGVAGAYCVTKCSRRTTPPPHDRIHVP